MATKDANDAVLEVSPPMNRGKELWADYCCTTQMRTMKVTYMWTIKDYNNLISKEINEVSSEKFWANDTPNTVWYMVLKIGSYNQSVELQLHHHELTLTSCQMSMKVEISILNAKSERKHNVISFEAVLQKRDKMEAFISQHFLMENSDDLLPRNSLTFYCEILQSKYVSIEKDKNLPVHKDRMSDDISKPFEILFDPDAVIDVQGTLFKVHKAVLAARSQVFAAMFKPDTKTVEKVESVVKIEDFQPTIFREVLRYIYKNEAKITESTVCELMIASDKYSLEDLKIICERTLHDIIKVKNAMHILVVANQLEITPLKQKVLSFIKSNLADVMKSKTWNEVLDSHTDLIMEILKMHTSD